VLRTERPASASPSRPLPKTRARIVRLRPGATAATTVAPTNDVLTEPSHGRTHRSIERSFRFGDPSCSMISMPIKLLPKRANGTNTPLVTAGTHAAKPHARWVPLAAALLAVIAAIASLLSNKSGTEAMSLKKSSDLLPNRSGRFVQLLRIQEHQRASLRGAPRCQPYDASAYPRETRAVAKREKIEKVPILEKARAQEEQAKTAIERSERYAHAHAHE